MAGLKDFIKWFYRRPLVMLAIVAVISIVAVLGITRTTREFGYESMLPKSAESVRALKEAEKLFGGTAEEQILLELSGDLNGKFLRKLATYPEHLMSKKNIYGPFIRDVTTPLDQMSYIPKGFLPSVNGASEIMPGQKAPSDDSLQSGQPSTIAYNAGISLSSAARHLSDEELVEQVKMNLQMTGNQGNSMSSGMQATVTPDGKLFLIMASLNTKTDPQRQMGLADVFVNDATRYFSVLSGVKIYIGGPATMSSDSNKRTMKDTRILFMLAFLFILFVLFVTFGGLSDVLFTLGVVLIAVLWVMGLGGWLGFPFTYQSTAIMPLMLGINIAYAIHVLSRYYEERRRGLDPDSASLKSVRTVGVAVFLTAMTTAFGFASFGISNMPPIRQFGVLCVSGVVFSFILAETLLPALLLIRDRREKARLKMERKILKRQAKDREGLADRVLARISILAEHHRKTVFALTLVTILCCGILATRITTEADFERMMPKDMPSLVAMKKINDYFGGQSIAYTLVRGDVLEPASLRAMLEYENEVSSYRGTTQEGMRIFERNKIMSVADLLVRATGKVPERRSDVELALEQMKNGMMGQAVSKLISEDGKVAIISMRVARGSQDEMKEITEVLRRKDSILKGLTVLHGGMPVLMTDLLGNLVPTQAKTALLALLLCTLLVSIIFKSVFFGLAAASLVFLGISLELAALSILRWPLDFMTVMVSSMIIGAGIDFGIHITHRFREEWRNGAVDVDSALRSTVVNVGRALLAAAATTAGAFGIIAISDISYLRRFGGITALALLFALLAALFVLPSILGFRAERVRERREQRETGEEGLSG